MLTHAFCTPITMQQSWFACMYIHVEKLDLKFTLKFKRGNYFHGWFHVLTIVGNPQPNAISFKNLIVGINKSSTSRHFQIQILRKNLYDML
jgi:hypothetical protein